MAAGITDGGDLAPKGDAGTDRGDIIGREKAGGLRAEAGLDRTGGQRTAEER
jgi:hypothetical protein